MFLCVTVWLLYIHRQMYCQTPCTKYSKLDDELINKKQLKNFSHFPNDGITYQYMYISATTSRNKIFSFIHVHQPVPVLLIDLYYTPENVIRVVIFVVHTSKWLRLRKGKCGKKIGNCKLKIVYFCLDRSPFLFPFLSLSLFPFVTLNGNSQWRY